MQVTDGGNRRRLMSVTQSSGTHASLQPQPPHRIQTVNTRGSEFQQLLEQTWVAAEAVHFEVREL